MEQTYSSEDLIKQYLFGELSAAEQIALEDEYFIDQAKYDQLRKVEEELLDRYARGSLSATDRERFERCYLANPARRRHLKFARALAQVIDEESATRAATWSEQIVGHRRELSWWSQFAGWPRGLRFALSLAAAIAVLVIGFGGAWLILETSRLRAQLAAAQLESARQQQRVEAQTQQIVVLEAQSRQLAEESERLKAQLQTMKETGSSSGSGSARAFLALSINEFRGLGNQEPRTLIIPRGAEEVRLRLALPEHKFSTFQLQLLTADGRELYTRKDLRPQIIKGVDYIIVDLPTHKIASGDNVVAVSGISATGEVETLGKVVIKVRRQ